MTKTGPLYYQIKEDIKQRIANQEFAQTGLLSTEKELCDYYQASRVTIRKSIELLITEGVLERGFGKTANIKCDRVPRDLNSLDGLHEELSKKGIKCSSYILSSECITVPEELRQKLDLTDIDQLLKIQRIRYANGIPLCYQDIYLNATLIPDLDTTQLVSHSLYGIIEQDYNIHIHHGNQNIQAIVSDYRVSSLLELPTPTCMLLITRTVYDEKNAFIEYSESQYIANRYSLNITLFREDKK